MWKFACPDWADRLAAGKSLLPDLPLDHLKAARAVAIFNKLRLPDVVGQPSLGEASGEWLRDIVRALFGSLDPVTGARHVQEIFAMVPKKNAKTTRGAAILMTVLLMNYRSLPCCTQPSARFAAVPVFYVPFLVVEGETGFLLTSFNGLLACTTHPSHTWIRSCPMTFAMPTPASRSLSL